MTIIMVFDTETTGLAERQHLSFNKQREHERSLLKDVSLWENEINKYPSIIQLAYILYDTDNPENTKIYNKYIDIPASVKISAESKSIHHITEEKIKGMSSFSKAYIYDSLNEFMQDFITADIVVGHNVDFDRRMIVAELLRISKEHNMPHIMELMKDENFECTQEITTPICKLKVKYEYIDSKTNIPKYIYKIKPTKLIEAYKHYFGYIPDGEHMHDAIIDAVICLRVYGMSFPGGQAFDICNTNENLREYILKVSPHNKDTCELTNKYLEQQTGVIMPGFFEKEKSKSESKSKSKSESKSKSKSESKSKSKSESKSKFNDDE